jgi:Glycosyltransferase family 87
MQFLPTADMTVAVRHLGRALGLGVLPAVLLGVIVAGAARNGTLGMDFVGGLLHGARAIAESQAPYHPARIQRIVQSMHPPVTPPIEETSYPPIALLGVIPLAFVPYWLAIAISTLIVGILPALALRVLGVSDWRCFGATYLSLPVMHAIMLGNTMPLMMLCLALCWRWRNHAVRCAAALAVMLAVKLIAFPLLVWLVVTRRVRAAGAATVIAVGVSLAAWEVIGFDQVRPYGLVLRGLAQAQQDGGYSLSSVAYGFGLADHATTLVIGVTALVLCGLWRLRGSSDRAFALATMASLTALPIVHQVYFALLLVPIAVVGPRFSWRWLVLLPFWLFPYESTAGHTLGFALTAVVVVGYLCATIRRPGRRGSVTGLRHPLALDTLIPRTI